MDFRKYAKHLSSDLFQLLTDMEKGTGTEVTALPPKVFVPIGARFIIEEGGVKKEYIKLKDNEYHLLGGGGSGTDAREIELQKSATYIQWRYVDDAEWINLVALSEITGTNGIDGSNGADGREVELRVDSGYIQWKYDTDVSWTNLIATDDLKGDTGQGIDHIEFTSTTAISGLANEPGETDTYTVWGDVEETINLGTFAVYNGGDGTDGTNGTNGVGVPAGGTTGQALVKASNDDYDTTWATISVGTVSILTSTIDDIVNITINALDNLSVSLTIT